MEEAKKDFEENKDEMNINVSKNIKNILNESSDSCANCYVGKYNEVFNTLCLSFARLSYCRRPEASKTEPQGKEKTEDL